MRRTLRRGFTLLEVVVAIAIAGFTVAALYALFSMQTRQFVTQDLQMEMHQNLRFATDMVTRSLRMAGYNTNGEAIGILDNLPSTDALPALVARNDALGTGTDAVTVVYGDPALVMDTLVTGDSSLSQLVFHPSLLDNAAKLAQFEAGDLLLCFDYADTGGMTAFLWEIAADYSGNGIISVHPNTTEPDWSGHFTTDTTVSPVIGCTKGNVYTFYIDDDSTTAMSATPGTDKHPVLMLDTDLSFPDATDVPLVDNIEDMQVEYCEDVGGTLATMCDQPSSWSNTTADGADVTSVWMARVTFVARSSREELKGLYRSRRPAVADRGAASATDAFFRQVLSTEVTLRTIRYLDFL